MADYSSEYVNPSVKLSISVFSYLRDCLKVAIAFLRLYLQFVEPSTFFKTLRFLISPSELYLCPTGLSVFGCI